MILEIFTMYIFFLITVKEFYLQCHAGGRLVRSDGQNFVNVVCERPYMIKYGLLNKVTWVAECPVLLLKDSYGFQ